MATNADRITALIIGIPLALTLVALLVMGVRESRRNADRHAMQSTPAPAPSPFMGDYSADLTSRYGSRDPEHMTWTLTPNEPGHPAL